METEAQDRETQLTRSSGAHEARVDASLGG